MTLKRRKQVIKKVVRRIDQVVTDSATSAKKVVTRSKHVVTLVLQHHEHPNQALKVPSWGRLYGKHMSFSVRRSHTK